MNSKLLGGILLIVGTSIGAGMLALPVTTAAGGFIGASIIFMACWLVMTFAAFLILEVNLWLPRNANLISMAKMTLGRYGELVAWLSYLLLLYSLLAAYISGGADVLSGLLNTYFYLTISLKITAIIFLVIFGLVVYQGIKSIDYVNRFLMITKLLTFLLLVIFILPNVHIQALSSSHINKLLPSITVVITSFGFATIIPSLRVYFEDDVKKLRIAILIGSLIPLICYILWIAVILAEIPLQGADGLMTMLTSADPNSSLVKALSIHLQNTWITSFAHVFTSICVATSFLGVSLCLVDFISDGMGLRKQGREKIMVFAITFLPPLALALFYPTAFIACLSYAGIFCAILLMLLPALMAWRGRYHLQMKANYRVVGGKVLLILIMCIAILVIVQDVFLKIT